MNVPYEAWLEKHNLLMLQDDERANEYVDKINRYLYENYNELTQQYYDIIFPQTQAVIINPDMADENNDQDTSETKAKKKGFFSWLKHKDSKKKKQNDDQQAQIQMQIQAKEEMIQIQNQRMEQQMEELRLMREQQAEERKQHQEQLKIMQEQTSDLQMKLNTMMPKMTFQAQTLGILGETELHNMFKSLNQFDLTIINQTQISHVSDLWMIDNEHNILFVVESKNKDAISKQDIDKFNNDLEYIKNTENHKTIQTQMNHRIRNNKQFVNNVNVDGVTTNLLASTKVLNNDKILLQVNDLFDKFNDYTVVGLFISLRTQNINQQIGSCSYTFDKTFIGNQCLSKEFLSMYIQTIITINNIQKFNQNEYQAVVREINEKYNGLKTLMTIVNSIQEDAVHIQTSASTISNELLKRIGEINESLVNIDIGVDSDVVKAEQKIMEYCRKTNIKKLRVADVKALANGLPVFNGAKITKDFCLRLKAGEDVLEPAIPTNK